METQNLYTDLKRPDINREFDFSGYPPGADGHFLYSGDDRKMELGLMKEELNGMISKEFVSLRPECYSLLYKGHVKDGRVVQRGNSEKIVARERESM